MWAARLSLGTWGCRNGMRNVSAGASMNAWRADHAVRGAPVVDGRGARARRAAVDDVSSARAGARVGPACDGPEEDSGAPTSFGCQWPRRPVTMQQPGCSSRQEHPVAWHPYDRARLRGDEAAHDRSVGGHLGDPPPPHLRWRDVAAGRQPRPAGGALRKLGR